MKHELFKHKLTIYLLIGTLASTMTIGLAATEIDHTKMDHSTHMMKTESVPANSSGHDMSVSTPLKEAGNDLFGTIQETISILDADPNTDWEKVDLEGLRQHLIDMDNFSSAVDVISQKESPKGAIIVIKAQNAAAQASLARAMAAHPAMLKSETGWSMAATLKGDTYELDLQTDNPQEITRLRALGYIGVMALGDHHQVHHWLMASGSDPHGSM